MTSPPVQVPPDASEPASAGPAPTSPPPAAASPQLSPTIRRLRAARAVLWALVGVMTVVWLFYGGGLESIPAMTPPPPGGGPPPAAEAVAPAAVGQAAPSLKLPLVGGGEQDLSTYRGRPVILNFWATWCD